MVRPGVATRDGGSDAVDVGAEVMRHVDLEDLLARELGGVLPADRDPRVVVSRLRRVLDLGCGYGAWAVKIATDHPHVDVHGVDIDEYRVGCAATLSQRLALDNVRFETADALQLRYPDDYFDLVNVRCVQLERTAWRQCLTDLIRMTRPGGLVRFTETDDVGATNSAAYEQLATLFLKACRLRGTSFSPTGRTNAVVPTVYQLLDAVGYRNVRVHVSLLDWSFGTPAYEQIARDMMLEFTGSNRSLILACQLATESELDHLCRDAQREVAATDFRAIWSFYTAIGHKPE